MAIRRMLSLLLICVLLVLGGCGTSQSPESASVEVENTEISELEENWVFRTADGLVQAMDELMLGVRGFQFSDFLVNKQDTDVQGRNTTIHTYSMTEGCLITLEVDKASGEWVSLMAFSGGSTEAFERFKDVIECTTALLDGVDSARINQVLFPFRPDMNSASVAGAYVEYESGYNPVLDAFYYVVLHANHPENAEVIAQKRADRESSVDDLFNLSGVYEDMPYGFDELLDALDNQLQAADCKPLSDYVRSPEPELNGYLLENGAISVIIRVNEAEASAPVQQIYLFCDKTADVPEEWDELVQAVLQTLDSDPFAVAEVLNIGNTLQPGLSEAQGNPCHFQYAVSEGTLIYSIAIRK